MTALVDAAISVYLHDELREEELDLILEHFLLLFGFLLVYLVFNCLCQFDAVAEVNL